MEYSELGGGGTELLVLALTSGVWGGKAKGERNGMNESTLARVAEAVG